MNQRVCPKCGKELANRDRLSRQKKNCSNGSYMTNQLDIGVRRSMVPAARYPVLVKNPTKLITSQEI